MGKWLQSCSCFSSLAGLLLSSASDSALGSGLAVVLVVVVEVVVVVVLVVVISIVGCSGSKTGFAASGFSAFSGSSSGLAGSAGWLTDGTVESFSVAGCSVIAVAG